MYILYPVLFHAVQTRQERSQFYIRTLKQEKRGSSHFSPFKNKSAAQNITLAVFKKPFICER